MKPYLKYKVLRLLIKRLGVMNFHKKKLKGITKKGLFLS